MLLDVAWVLDTAVRSWVPISCDSSWQSSLGWGMLDFFWDATLLRRVISPAWWDLNAPLPGFSHFLGLFPSSFAPLWIFFCQIPHVTEGKCSQFLCLILNPSILSGMGSVQGIIFFLYLCYHFYRPVSPPYRGDYRTNTGQPQVW